MSKHKRIAIDAMGGDFGPPVTVPAAIRALAAHEKLTLLLVGNEVEIKAQLLGSDERLLQRLEILHTSVCVENDSKPESVLRKSKESSMFVAVNLVKEGRADACVSAGNTGALLLAGRHLLKNIPGISKPAIIASVPLRAMGRNAYILDVGANLHSDAAQLQEFAIMGSIQARAVSRIDKPRVALLNVGHEEHKGPANIRAAAELLQRTESLNYVGYVEGNEIFMDRADVVVCDGFAGNITIKTSAGVVRVIEQLLKERASSSFFSGLLSFLAAPLLRQLRAQLDPAQFNGASILGLQGIVVKSHGNARSQAFFYVIEQALKEVTDCVPSLIGKCMESLHHSDGDALATRD